MTRGALRGGAANAPWILGQRKPKSESLGEPYRLLSSRARASRRAGSPGQIINRRYRLPRPPMHHNDHPPLLAAMEGQELIPRLVFECRFLHCQ